MGTAGAVPFLSYVEEISTLLPAVHRKHKYMVAGYKYYDAHLSF